MNRQAVAHHKAGSWEVITARSPSSSGTDSVHVAEKRRRIRCDEGLAFTHGNDQRRGAHASGDDDTGLVLGNAGDRECSAQFMRGTPHRFDQATLTVRLR